MTIQQNVVQKFEQHFGEAPQFVVRAPGRVNLIGEHTDYNDGFVLPMAIDRAVYIASCPRHDDKVIVHALDFDQIYEFDLNTLTKSDHSPGEYIKGAAKMLQMAGYTLTGWQGILQGDIPIGAGLSSSAALEMATIRTFAAVSGFIWDAAEMAKIGQQVENEWLGLKTGIMDQMISACGQKNYAILIDCRTMNIEAAPLPADTLMAVLDTTTSRGLVDSKYNERFEQCQKAARFFGVNALRDVSISTFEEKADMLDLLTRKRAKHVITENQRTRDAYNAMHAGDIMRLGQLMNASHESLRDDFEVSSDALNAIVDCARSHDRCYGARMTGAGFGGCAIALIQADAANDFTKKIATCYKQMAHLEPRIYITTAVDGASVIP